MDLIAQVRQNIKEATAFIQDRIEITALVAVILGSGLDHLVDSVDNRQSFSYREIPHFPETTVPGHRGHLVVGSWSGKPIIIMAGRLHYYEGYTMMGVTFPIRVLRELGVETLLITAAAGGLNRSLLPGDLMVIKDHINLMSSNPLIGPHDETLGPRFLDLSQAYDPNLIKVAKRVAREKRIVLKEGVYVAVNGPTYETPAEVNFLARFADAVGMSVVPEVIVARHSGLRVMGIAVISNSLAKVSQVDHKAVLEVVKNAEPTVRELLAGVIAAI
jgi:purine-nucleoside phosphorylase